MPQYTLKNSAGHYARLTRGGSIIFHPDFRIGKGGTWSSENEALMHELASQLGCEVVPFQPGFDPDGNPALDVFQLVLSAAAPQQPNADFWVYPELEYFAALESTEK